MQTQTLKIEIPAGFQIESLDKSTGVIKLSPKKGPVTEIKTVPALLAYHRLTQQEFDEQSIALRPHEKAFRLLDLLCGTLNEGWIPDWKNSQEPKYYPWFEMGGSSGFRFDGHGNWYSYSIVGSRLCFKSSALAEHAGRHFLDVYEQFMVVNSNR